MPTYEYRCKSCGYEFEEFQPMSADPLQICPKCTEPTLKRLMSSGVGLVFKGSGFYLTDYKNTSSAPTAPKPSSESKPESKPEQKSESKPSDNSATSTDKK
jgi:putative FmdB family regulatory protein